MSGSVSRTRPGNEARSKTRTVPGGSHFPRGTRLDLLDQGYVDDVAAIINGQRRRNLAYQRPADLYAAATVQ
jgi:hypothetical protein